MIQHENISIESLILCGTSDLARDVQLNRRQIQEVSEALGHYGLNLLNDDDD
jgi:hypothetical protein